MDENTAADEAAPISEDDWGAAIAEQEKADAAAAAKSAEPQPTVFQELSPKQNKIETSAIFFTRNTIFRQSSNG